MTVVEYVIKLNDQLSKGLTKIGSKVKQIDQNISTLGTGISAVALIGGINKAINAWDKQDQAVTQVRQGLISTGNAAGKTLDELTKKAKEFQKDTLFGDETVLGGVTAQLLTFTNIAGKQFDRTQQAILDVTTRIYGADASAESLRSTSIQLGKALNDPVANLGALGRSGIQFTKQQKEVIKSLWEAGRTAEAQTIILNELDKQYGGSAAAAAKAGKGGLKQLKNTLGDILEIIGSALMPTINRLTKIFGSLASFVQNNEKLIRILIPIIVSFVGSIITLIAAIKAWVFIQKVINVLLTANPIGLIIAAIAALVAGIIALWNNSEKFRGVILGVWEVMKAFGEFIKSKFGPLMDTLRGGFDSIGKAIWEGIIKRLKILLEGLKGIGRAFKALFEGEFKKAVEEAGKAFVNLSPVAMVTGKSANELIKAGKKAGDIFQKGFEKGKKVKGIADPLNKFINQAGAEMPGAPESLKAQVTGAAPKVFNINIQNMKAIENFYNQKGTVAENTNDIGASLTEMLLNSLADIQLTSR